MLLVTVAMAVPEKLENVEKMKKVMTEPQSGKTKCVIVFGIDNK